MKTKRHGDVMRVLGRHLPVLVLGLLLWRLDPEPCVWQLYGEAVSTNVTMRAVKKAETSGTLALPEHELSRASVEAAKGPSGDPAADPGLWTRVTGTPGAAERIFTELKLASGKWSGKAPAYGLTPYIRRGMLPLFLYTPHALGLEGD